MPEIVQLVFVEDPKALPRLKFFLRMHIPHKVYFLRAEEEEVMIRRGIVPRPQTDTASALRKTLERELPGWVAKNSKTVKVSYFNFARCLPALVRLIRHEQKKGREVYINLHGGSRILSTAAFMAAKITGTKAFWIEPDRWALKKMGEYEVRIPVGAKRAVEIEVPVDIALPGEQDRRILAHFFDRGGSVKGTLESMSRAIGFKNLGEGIRKSSSAIVKLSRSLSRLKEEGLVTTAKPDRQTFQVSLTEKGRVVGEIVSILEE